MSGNSSGQAKRSEAAVHKALKTDVDPGRRSRAASRQIGTGVERGGKRSTREFENVDLANDSDDEKQIQKAEFRAELEKKQWKTAPV